MFVFNSFLISLITSLFNSFLFIHIHIHIIFRLGATRHMIQIPHEDTILKLISQNKNLNDYYFFTHENLMYDISRPRILLKDFLIIRYITTPSRLNKNDYF